jgi:hypothetical protein
MSQSPIWFSKPSFVYALFYKGNSIFSLWAGFSQQPVTFVRISSDVCSKRYQYGMDNKGYCDLGKPISVTRREWL